MLLYHDTLKISDKGKNDFVTEIDKAVEEKIIATLRVVVPESFFIAEEQENDWKMDGEGFIIDPIDGTNNFINGVPFCAICI